MNPLKEGRTDAKSDPNEADREDPGAREETAERTEPATPLIDQDFAESVNAALPETDR